MQPRMLPNIIYSTSIYMTEIIVMVLFPNVVKVYSFSPLIPYLPEVLRQNSRFCSLLVDRLDMEVHFLGCCWSKQYASNTS